MKIYFEDILERVPDQIGGWLEGSWRNKAKDVLTVIWRKLSALHISEVEISFFNWT